MNTPNVKDTGAYWSLREFVSFSHSNFAPSNPFQCELFLFYCVPLYLIVISSMSSQNYQPLDVESVSEDVLEHEPNSTLSTSSAYPKQGCCIDIQNAGVIVNSFLDDLNFGVLAGRAYCQSHRSYHGRNVGRF